LAVFNFKRVSIWLLKINIAKNKMLKRKK